MGASLALVQAGVVVSIEVRCSCHSASQGSAFLRGGPKRDRCHVKLFPSLFKESFLICCSTQCCNGSPGIISYHGSILVCGFLFKLMFLEGEEHWKLPHCLLAETTLLPLCNFLQ